MRKSAVVLAGGLAIVLSVAAAAWACTNLATLNLSAASGQPGTVVNLTGTAFATKGGSPVVIHWDSLDGPVLATTNADPTGTVHASVAIPADAQPGPHILIAKQDYTDDKGVTTAAYGTPARASFMVGAPPFEAAASRPAAPPVATGAEGGSGGLVAFAIILALGGFGLFGAGLAVFSRQAGRQRVPAPVKKQ